MGPTPLCERLLEGDASCLAVLPQDAGRSLLCVGTYNNVSGTRTGALCFYDIMRDARSLEEVCSVPSAAVFDLAWEPVPTAPLLGMAGADGSLHIYRVSSELGAVECSEQASLLLGGDASGTAEPPLCTSVSWDPFALDETDRSLASCGQDGQVHVVRLAEGRLSVEASWEGHTLEAWVARWDDWRPRTLYSGGDDSAFCWRGLPARTPCADTDAPHWDTASQAPAFRLRKAHAAGVCAIACSPHEEFTVATGSYDESFRVWDVRSLSQPLQTGAVACGGGIWRVCWHPSQVAVALCACMQNGFAVVKGTEVAESYCSGAQQGQHGSLGYGVQWCAFAPAAGPGGVSNCDVDGNEMRQQRSLAVTCSFYDRSLHLWEPAI